MRILIATDAWRPQVNGVVRTLEQTAHALSSRGVEVEFLTPAQYPQVALPGYPEIKLALVPPHDVIRKLKAGRFDTTHIATEGPIGWAARRACRRLGLTFTTSYHTRFPEYLRARAPIPEAWSYSILRRFHNSAAATMVATESLRTELLAKGFRRLMIWSRGVDTDLFRPRAEKVLDLPRPIFLYVGRLAVEKNVDGFLRLDLPGSKVVVGDGPERARLQRAYPAAVFLGAKVGSDLAAIYASADVFVFPSRTDTYGIVLLEALASGLPIAAFPAPGPRDVIGTSKVGVLAEDLRAAAVAALTFSSSTCRELALRHTWARSAEQFLTNVALAHSLAHEDRV